MRPLLAPRTFFNIKAESKTQGQGRPEEGPIKAPRAQPGHTAEAFSSDQGYAAGGRERWPCSTAIGQPLSPKGSRTVSGQEG